MKTQLEKAQQFQALHERNTAFIIPNPWDPGSARLLQGMGFEALATTSAGYAQSIGRLDGDVSLEEMIEHCREISQACGIPVSADLENCYADAPEEAARAIRLGAEAGLAGASIEDYDGSRIYDFDQAVERVRAAAEVAHGLDTPFVLTARAENLLRGHDDLEDTIRRLQAYEDAGADVLYAPALTSLEQIRQVVAAINKPLNVLSPFIPDATLADFSAAGVRRVSIGGALANTATGAMLAAAKEMMESGSFNWLSGMASRSEIARLLRSE
jgi:2-methylisocitrate lyase-like PEP mutase family enzyme